MSAAAEPQDLTQLLRRLRAGDEEAAAQVAAAAYGELRKLAARCLRRERPGHTLQPTALVHEAFLKLAANTRTEWRDRAQFYAVAARLMRRILVDYARRRAAGKRGGGHQVTLEENLVLREERIEDVLGVDEVLERLEALDPRQGRIVELRFFSGLTVEEIAEVLGISTPTVKREWSSAKAWLHRELSPMRKQAKA
ncbi:MAG TPA: ECF-type sigma factor [Bryobacteraceae bacterium]